MKFRIKYSEMGYSPMLLRKSMLAPFPVGWGGVKEKELIYVALDTAVFLIDTYFHSHRNAKQKSYQVTIEGV